MGKKLVLLFVCSGNTCRSVMAEGLFNKAWSGPGGVGGIQAVAGSAGMETVDGLAASEEALQVLRDAGVDLAHHRSRCITAALIGEADYIFTMTRRQKESLLQRFPPARGKTWLLAECAGIPQQEGISDPFGRGLRHYRRAARQIGEAVQKIVGKLVEKLKDQPASKKAGREN